MKVFLLHYMSRHSFLHYKVSTNAKNVEKIQPFVFVKVVPFIMYGEQLKSKLYLDSLPLSKKQLSLLPKENRCT